MNAHREVIKQHMKTIADTPEDVLPLETRIEALCSLSYQYIATFRLPKENECESA